MEASVFFLDQPMVVAAIVMRHNATLSDPENANSLLLAIAASFAVDYLFFSSGNVMCWRIKSDQA